MINFSAVATVNATTTLITNTFFGTHTTLSSLIPTMLTTTQTNSPSVYTNVLISSSSAGGYCGNTVGGGNIRLSIESMMDQVRMMRKPDLDDFVFRIIKERYDFFRPEDGDDDDVALADTALSYAQEALRRSGHVLPTGVYHLPDGAVLTVQANQNYAISDQNAKVTYAANRNRQFNEYVNVSDILDQFMKYAAGMKLTREQFLTIPLQTFLMWLIMEAAKKDGEIVRDDDVKQLELALSSPLL